MPKRRRLARGVYEDAHGISVVYYINGQRASEKRFDPGTPLDKIKRWRTTQLGQAQSLHPRDPRGSLARDIVRYLKRLKGTAGFKSERAHLRAWLKRWPKIKRWQITQEKVELAIADWRQADVSPRTIRHRCRVLEALFHRLDGSKAQTPLDDATIPSKPKPRPVSVSDETINTVAANLKTQEEKGRLWDAKTRARFLVLATTGRRPCEVQRAQAVDVDLTRRLWFTRTAKGGLNTAILLNSEMLAAWTLFASANAWGEYDCRSFSKTLKRNGWPGHIRPYNLRHSTAIAIRTRGGDLGDVKDLLGHASIQTAEENYLHIVPARQAATSKSLEGRILATAFLPTPSPKKRAARLAKGLPKATQMVKARSAVDRRRRA